MRKAICVVLLCLCMNAWGQTEEDYELLKYLANSTGTLLDIMEGVEKKLSILKRDYGDEAIVKSFLVKTDIEAFVIYFKRRLITIYNFANIGIMLYITKNWPDYSDIDRRQLESIIFWSKCDYEELEALHDRLAPLLGYLDGLMQDYYPAR